jgi:hypothetical protein
MSGARRLRRGRRPARGAVRAIAAATVATVATLAMVACVGPRGSAPLPAAGDREDDGAGQLAQASIQVRLGAGVTGVDDELERVRSAGARYYRRGSASGWTPGSGVDPSLAGSVYGLDTSVGGMAYGIGPIGFGIVGPRMTPRRAIGDGAVLGALTWRADRGVAWPAGCAGARVAKAGGPVAGAVVSLASAPLRRDRIDDDRWTVARGAIVADDCAPAPAAQPIGPVPGLVEVENGGRAPTTVSAGRAGKATLDPGGRWTFAVADLAPVRVDADGRAPAWLVGQTHDFATVTDGLGRFAIDAVPAGTYELVVWYPPLVRTLDGARPVWTDATTVRRTVTVGTTGTVRLAVALDPAP